MRAIEVVKRYILFVLSLFVSAIGVAFAKIGGLGVSPISSVANVLSIQFMFLSLGNWLIIWNCVLILGQVLILRKKFKLIQLLQIPLSFLFGYFTDFGVFLVKLIPIDNTFYPYQVLMVLIGIIVVGLGVSLSVIANVIMNSGEAFVKAISDTINKPFGNVKVVFDVSCVVIAVALSFIFFQKLEGTREGTIATALLTGFVVKFFQKILSNPLNKILSK